MAKQEVEVEHLVAMGTTRIDIGQGDMSWVVMTDPDGGAFCVVP
jgi:Glyoxalase-like domain